MSTTSSLNTVYSSIQANNKGVGGLASGLDTEELVKTLTANTRSKIAKQQQSKQTIQWKQSAYRTVASNLREFQDKYLTTGKDKYVGAQGFFNVYKSVVSSNAVSVNHNSTTMPGVINISQINSLASSMTIQSKRYEVDITGEFTIDATTDFTGKTLKLQLDGKASSERTIDLTYIMTGWGSQPAWVPGVSDENDLKAALQALISDNTKGIGNAGLDSSNNIINIVDVSITSDGLGGYTIQLEAPSNKLTVIEDCSVLGLTYGSMNQINTNQTLESLFPDLATAGYKGQDLIFNINGVEIRAKTTDTITNFMGKVNNANADVRIEFNSLSQSFVIAAKKTGAGNTIEMADLQGNVLSQIFGLDQGGSTLITENLGLSLSSDGGKTLSALFGLTGSGTLNIDVGDPATNYPIAYSDTMSLQDFMDRVNAIPGVVMSISNGEVRISSDEKVKFSDVSGGFLEKVYGVTSYETADAPGYSSTTKQGTNAVIVLADGTVIPSTTNSFEINGIAFDVNFTHNIDGLDSTAQDITINVTTDNETLVENIQEFIDDYNALVGTIIALTKEEGDSNYYPLSDEQKAELTKEEIEKWEEEAKKGLLRNDSTLLSIVNQMRRLFYDTVESVDLAPYQIGLQSKSLYNSTTRNVDYEVNGQIELKADVLLEALENSSDLVRQVFTDSKDGLVTKMNDIITAAAKVTVVEKDRGTLIAMAGDESLAANTSTMGRRIIFIDQQIATLKNRLEKEYTRYWRKFSLLETTISNISAQSSWLSETLSS